MNEHVDGLYHRPDVLLGARPSDACLSGGVRQLPGKVQRDHQNGDIGEHFGDLPGDVDSVQIGHLVVQNHQIWGGLEDLVKSFGAGSRLSADLPRLLLFKDGAQVAPDSGIIVDEKYASHAKASAKPV